MDSTDEPGTFLVLFMLDTNLQLLMHLWERISWERTRILL